MSVAALLPTALCMSVVALLPTAEAALQRSVATAPSPPRRCSALPSPAPLHRGAKPRSAKLPAGCHVPATQRRQCRSAASGRCCHWWRRPWLTQRVSPPETPEKMHGLETLIKRACNCLLSVSQALELEIHASNKFTFSNQHQTAASSFWVLISGVQ